MTGRCDDNKCADILFEDISGSKNVLLRCLDDSGHSWSSDALECILSHHCFSFFYHANPHHCLLAFSPSLQRRSIEWFRRKLRFYREIAIRAAISSSVSFFKRRVICFPCKGQISGGEDDIILHARRSDVKSHLRASPLPFAHLTFHRVYNGFLSRGIVQVMKEAVVMKANY